MKTIFIIMAAIFIISAMAQPKCLLQDPLTDICIESISIDTVQQQLAQYLCSISYRRKLYVKAEQFCAKSVQLGDESAYNYFNSLLANKKLLSALKTDYMLFFAKPFDHNSKLTASIEQISQLLATLSTNSEQLSKLDDLEKAILYFYLKETQKSLDHLTSYLSLHKQDKKLIYQHLLMLRILQKQYKYYQALEYVQKVIKNNSDLHPYIYHLKGNLLMHHIQFRKAIPQFEKANAQFYKMYKSNGFSFTNYNIGLCYQKLGDIEHAIKYYEKSIINLPSAEALNALGHAHYSSFEKTKNKKALDIAETYYKKSLQTKPQYTIAIFNLGMLELETQNIQKSISYFNRCSDSIRSCKYGLIKAYYKGNNSAPVDEIVSSIDKNQQTITQLTAILYEMGDYSKALQIIGDRQYKSSDLYQWKGFNEYALDKYEPAESSFARAIFLGNKKGSTYYSLGLTQLHLKKYSQCAVSFDHAYKLDPRKDTKQQLQTCRKLQKQSDL